MFLSREIDIKLFKLTRKFIYIKCCIKIVGLNRSYSANLIYKFWFNFGTVSYQFLETGTSDIELLQVSSTPEVLRFQPIPLSFFFTVPLSQHLF